MTSDWPAKWGRLRRLPPQKECRAALGIAPDACLWCRAPSIRALCSTECRREWRIRSESYYARMKVADRDGGLCAFCGVVAEKWHADHILPVWQGGGCCGLENLRTLCETCHERHTRETMPPLTEARIQPQPSPLKVFWVTPSDPFWRDGSKWTPEQDQELIAARRSGMGRRAIATQMGRTRDAVRGRMVLLGVK